jgi:hypothetical protein
MCVSQPDLDHPIAWFRRLVIPVLPVSLAPDIAICSPQLGERQPVIPLMTSTPPSKPSARWC